MRQLRFKTQFNYTPVTKELKFKKSQVQVRPGLSIREMVDRYVQTGEIPNSNGLQGLYYDEEFANPQNFDLSDLTDAQQVIDSVKAKKDSFSSSKKGRATKSQGEGGASKAPDDEADATGSERGDPDGSE